MRKPPALSRAELYWAAGKPLPLDIEVELMALGLCPSRLQASFLKRRKTSFIG